MNDAAKATKGKLQTTGKPNKEDARKAINRHPAPTQGQQRSHIAEHLTSSVQNQTVGREHEIHPSHVSPDGFYDLDEDDNFTDHN